MTSDPLEDAENAPGGRAALARGCLCSVLANAAFRAGSGDQPALIEPGCPVHHPADNRVHDSLHDPVHDPIYDPVPDAVYASASPDWALEPRPAAGQDPADPWTP